jgi:hypothetical protein
MDASAPIERLEDLEPLQPSHLDRYKDAVTGSGQFGWGYYFPYLLAKGKAGRSAVLLGEDAGSLCLYQWQAGDSTPRLELAFPPLPFDHAALGRCLERANEYNGDRSARILRIDQKDADVVAEHPGIRVRQRRSQYVYAPANYEDLSGKRFRTLRRQVAAFEQVDDIEIVAFEPAHRPACHELLRGWKRAHRAAHGTAGGAGTTTRSLDLVGELPERDLTGQLIFLGGRLVAFTLGGEIRPGVACFFDAKSDPSVPGISYAQRHRFLLRMRDFEYLNDGSDTGREGLRQLKDSLRPVMMHPEFRGSQSTS